MSDSWEFGWVSLFVLGLLLLLFSESISLPVDLLNEFGVMFIWRELKIFGHDVFLGWDAAVEFGEINSLEFVNLWN